MHLHSLHYHKEQKAVTFLINRFCWEIAHEHEKYGSYYRVHAGFCAHNVDDVSWDQPMDNSFSPKNTAESGSEKDLLLNLLSIENKNGYLLIHFSGHKTLRLKISPFPCGDAKCGGVHEKLADIKLFDNDHPWPTLNKPKHLFEHLEELLEEQAVGV